jgi:P27 family predicted phage terminase small subunit
MGRKPKPLSLQISEGDPRKRGKHKLLEAQECQPKAAKGLPDCPRHLRGRARSAWNFLRAELESMDLDRRPDALALEGGCLAYAAAIAAEETLAEEGCITTEPVTKGGQVVGTIRRTHPATRVRNAAWARFTQFCDRFGLSPQAREHLSIEPAADPSGDLMQILSEPRVRKTAKGEEIQ